MYWVCGEKNNRILGGDAVAESSTKGAEWARENRGKQKIPILTHPRPRQTFKNYCRQTPCISLVIIDKQLKQFGHREEWKSVILEFIS